MPDVEVTCNKCLQLITGKSRSQKLSIHAFYVRLADTVGKLIVSIDDNVMDETAESPTTSRYGRLVARTTYTRAIRGFILVILKFYKLLVLFNSFPQFMFLYFNTHNWCFKQLI